MLRYAAAISLLSIFIGTLRSADAPIPWSDVNVPVAGHRYTYRGFSWLINLTASTPNLEVTVEYANVEPTANGVRFDVIERIINLPSGLVSFDSTETRELRDGNEVLLRRVDRGANTYFRSDNLRDVTFTQGNIAPRTFELGRSYVYDLRLANPAGIAENRRVVVEKYENVATEAGSFRTIKIASSGLVYGQQSNYNTWSAKNVGPVRITRNLGISQADYSLVSTNFPLEPGVFDEPGPKIVAEPESLAVAAGATARFRVIAEGEGLTFSWTKDGVPIAGASSGTLTLAATNSSSQGLYQATVTAFGRSVLSQPARLMVSILDSSAGKLVNMSVRALARENEGQLIAGMVIQGAATPHRVLVRAAGPWLKQFGLSDYCRDPALTLQSGSGTLIAANDNWGQYSDQPALRALSSAVGAFPFVAGSTDAALSAQLGTGSYTALIRDQTGGAALLEAYDADTDRPGGFVNLSVRSEINGSPLIIGFVVTGNGPVKVLVRGIGPSLTRFGVPNVLPNPRLRVIGDDEIAVNDDWSTGTQREELRTGAAAAGAFPLDENSPDAALIAVLRPGAYTATIESPSATGSALIEVYLLPN